MAENTKIEWATHTFNPWIGCAKVHTGCANCYAEAMAGRLGVNWGPHGTRRRTAESTWKQVERWNRLAGSAKPAMEPSLGGREAEGQGDERAVRPRVFPSLCDPFEDWGGVIQGTAISTFNDIRRDFFSLIDRCENLDFLLLTKRPENVRWMWPSAYWMMDGVGSKRDNVWLVYSASDQQSLEAGLPHLLRCRDLVPVIGLSLEPLLGPVDLAFPGTLPKSMELGYTNLASVIDWVIVGGESGPRHRPMDLAWLESIADQCSAAGVPLFVKQDAGHKPGQQGRIPNYLWARKELPS